MMYTVSEAADYLKISTDSVVRAIASGRLVAVDHGTRERHCYRITEQALADYLAAITFKPPTPKPPRTNRRQTTGRWFS